MMTDDDIQTLFYLVHDKSHIMRPGSTTPQLDHLIQSARTGIKTALYRGLCKEDVAFLEGMMAEYAGFSTYTGYLSFSEDEAVAWKFAKSYGTQAIMRIRKPIKKFPLALDLAGALRPLISEDADGADIDVLEALNIEKEWIFASPRIIIKRKSLAGHGRTVYDVTLITL